MYTLYSLFHVLIIFSTYNSWFSLSSSLCYDLRTCFLARLNFEIASQTVIIQNLWKFSLHSLSCKDVSLISSLPSTDGQVVKTLFVGCTTRFEFDQVVGNLNLAFKIQDSIGKLTKNGSFFDISTCKMHFVQFDLPKSVITSRASIRIVLNQVEREVHIKLCDALKHHLYYHKKDFLFDLQAPEYYLWLNTTTDATSKRNACTNITKMDGFNDANSLSRIYAFDMDRYRRLWTNLNCSSYFQIDHVSNTAIDWRRKRLVADKEWCMRTYYDLKGKSTIDWKLLPEPVFFMPWKDKECNAVVTWQLLEWAPKPSCWHLGWYHLNNASLPLIAILAASSSRHIRNPSTKTIALFFHLLPSLVQTIDCGFRYEFVLGYDEGDSFYDTEIGREEVKEWFRKYISDPLTRNNLKMTLRMVRVKNKIQKPGPVFQEMGRVAYEDGAEYFYRVNDDTELVSKHWPTIFVTTLKSLTVPYGVVGPYCREGNFPVLTHDFTHRSHLEIFGMNYYPPLLVDWWLDDWISFVYGQNRTFRASMVRVIHHVNAHGQRYEVDRGNEQYFLPYLKSERMKIREYMVSHGGSTESVEKFDRDNTAAYYKILDIPKSVQDNLREILGEKEWSALLQQGFRED